MSDDVPIVAAGTKDDLGPATRPIRRPNGDDSLVDTLVVAPPERAQCGRYEIVGSLGQGGMGEVMLARTRGGTADGIERFVALKRLLPHVVANPDHLNMFIDEARICSRLSHENLAQVIEFGQDGDTPFLAMEYVHGVSVKQILAEGDDPPPAEVTAYVVACVCAGLHHAHTRKDDLGRPLRVIHRDVSPSNVLVGADGQVKLIDFGVARAAERLHQTVGATIKGSFAYMSPEQASAAPLDHRSDIFSTGTLLYVMLTGTNPFVGNSVLQTVDLVRRAQAPAPHTVRQTVPPELEAICVRAMAREPKDRFPWAAEMQQALERYCHTREFSARGMRLWVRTSFPDLTEKPELGALSTASVARDATVTAEGPAALPATPVTPLPDTGDITSQATQPRAEEPTAAQALHGATTRQIDPAADQTPAPDDGLPPTPVLAQRGPPAPPTDTRSATAPPRSRKLHAAVLAASVLALSLVAVWLFWRTATSSAIIADDVLAPSIAVEQLNVHAAAEAALNPTPTQPASTDARAGDANGVYKATPVADAAPDTAAAPAVPAQTARVAPPRAITRRARRHKPRRARPRRRSPSVGAKAVPPATPKRPLGDEGATW